MVAIPWGEVQAKVNDPFFRQFYNKDIIFELQKYDQREKKRREKISFPKSVQYLEEKLTFWNGGKKIICYEIFKPFLEYVNRWTFNYITF